jgi:hypothetical protein
MQTPIYAIAENKAPQFHPMIPSASIKGSCIEPAITDTLRPMIPASPTPKCSFCGNCMVAAGVDPNEKEYSGFV